MQKHMRQQFEQFQHGLVSAFEQSAKLAGPMLRTNEVMVDGFSQLLKDQVEFGQSCMAIGHRQMTAFMRASGPAALRASRDAASDYYAAASKYGEAMRSNAVQTHHRLMAIGDAATHTPAPATAQADSPAVKTATVTTQAGHATASKESAATTNRKSPQQAKPKTAPKAAGKTTRKPTTKTADKTAKRKTPTKTAATAKTAAPVAGKKAVDTSTNAPTKAAKNSDAPAKAKNNTTAKRSSDG